MSGQPPLNTSAVDLFVPADRFASASRLNGRLHRTWLLLRRYWWINALVLVGVLVPAFLWATHCRPTYESRARMWLTGRLDLYEGRLYTEELINYLGTQVELLRSPNLQRHALERLLAQSQGTRVSPVTAGASAGILDGAKSWWTSLLGAAASGSNGPPPVPFQVQVTEGSKSSTLDLRAVGDEPAATRAFLDALMAEYLQFKQQAREQTSDRASSSLATEVARLKHELDAQEEKLHDFQSSNDIVFLQGQGNSAASYLADLNRQLAALRTEGRLLKTLQPEEWVELKPELAATATGRGAAEDAAARERLASLAAAQAELFKANQQMALLKAKRAELARFLRPDHPKIKKFDEDIATQEKIVQVSREEALHQLARRRQAIESQIQNLEAESTDWNARALAASRKLADYAQLQQNLQRVQTAYDKTLALIQTVDVGKKVEQENVGILEAASVAVPTHRRLRNLALALAGALLLNFGLLYGLALFRDDFTSLTELSQELAGAVVGQIPAISLHAPKGRPGIEALEKQRFEFLEAFRSLRSSLLFMGNGGPKPHTIAIASSIPEEGKSTVALYLAATMAQANARVLLVDADMRRASLHRFFGVAARPGLAELLNEEASYAEAIVATGFPNLSLVPAGHAKRNPGELVLSPVWADFLKVVKPYFDFVLVDTPPLLATDDAAALAPKADGVLFVVRGSFTSARLARSALAMLRQRQTQVLGLLLNRAVSSPYQHHYYHPYQAAYQWETSTAGHVAVAEKLLEKSRQPGAAELRLRPPDAVENA